MSLNLLPTIKASFQKYLTTGARSNEKLKILHAKIAADLAVLLGKGYVIRSLGYGEGRENVIQGRYIEKVVDITIENLREQPVAGIAVKFVMSNYAQNSNNYFENMLGETANIRCANIPYFQILIIPEEMPYYERDGTIKKAEIFSAHHVQKYAKLSEDNPSAMFHTPDKTLLMVVALPKLDIKKVGDKAKYTKAYTGADVKLSNAIKGPFKSAVILNDYDAFMTKVAHRIKAV
ncbi:MAG: hypothetical protein LBH81_01225 [Rickettsiales bacterium]|jgi:hypothetical protein|nr:hypothetical protein [Rickettsiales bacterium]